MKIKIKTMRKLINGTRIIEQVYGLHTREMQLL
jgi:hypothetical protein